MANRIDNTFRNARKRKEGLFIGFVTAGDPDFKTSLQISRALISGGVDILELGLPFSDPIADGPVIQKSSQRSLKAGMNPDRFFSYVREMRKKQGLPIVCLTYYNLVLHRGLERFAADCRKNGVDGLVIPDLPVEEAAPLCAACTRNNVRLIFLVAPTTTDERLKRILKAAKGFVYVVSVRGTTGVRSKLSGDVPLLLQRIRKINTAIPLAVGFGISTPKQVKAVFTLGAQAAIVGSALVKVIEENIKDKNRMLSSIERQSRELEKAAKRRVVSV
jgi:tryptophan synthase alpha chain